MLLSFLAIMAIMAASWLGAEFGLRYIFGVILPLAALPVFGLGFLWRVIAWARSPVPFAIPTVAGQQKTLPWIRASRFDAPWTRKAVAGRMALEIVGFRSLLRNTRAVRYACGQPRLAFFSAKWLWLFALFFHYGMLIILVRHTRFVLAPPPFWLNGLEFVDGLFEIGTPRFYLSEALLLAGLIFLLLRRLGVKKLRYISLPGDYFILLLLLAVAASGIAMRYFWRIDVAQAKVLIMSLVRLQPVGAADMEKLAPIFFVHLTFVSVLFMCFPFSKLMHMGGIFLSPTRNLRCNTREKRHINPWNPPQRFHTYMSYENEFRELMGESGLPLEKRPETQQDDFMLSEEKQP